MTGLPSKPATIAGFLLWVICASHPGDAQAQDYIDVEAERRARAGGAAQNGVISDLGESQFVEAQPGIRPYSGTTTMGQPPLDASPNPITGTDSGSLILRLQQLEADVRRLNGLLEEATQALRMLEEQSLERYVDIDRRLSGGSPIPAAGDGSVQVPTDDNAALGQADTRGRTVDAQSGEEAAYRSAYDLVRAREFVSAVTAFKDFLGDYPFGRYAPNAHYWLGELYLVVDPPEPELARQNFKLLLDQYPADPKVPDALYKLGRVQFIKGNREKSREYLDEVIREYPSHAAAQLARQFLLENF